MRATAAVILAMVIYVLQAVLALLAAAVVGFVGVRARSAAPWVFTAFLIVMTAVASASGGYSAIRVAHSAFRSVQPLVVQVGASTLFVVYAAGLTLLWVSGVTQPFESNAVAVGFYVNLAIALYFMRLAVRWQEEEPR